MSTTSLLLCDHIRCPYLLGRDCGRSRTEAWVPRIDRGNSCHVQHKLHTAASPNHILSTPISLPRKNKVFFWGGESGTFRDRHDTQARATGLPIGWPPSFIPTTIH
jgi:hypothetical protein